MWENLNIMVNLLFYMLLFGVIVWTAILIVIVAKLAPIEQLLLQTASVKTSKNPSTEKSEKKRGVM